MKVKQLQPLFYQNSQYCLKHVSNLQRPFCPMCKSPSPAPTKEIYCTRGLIYHVWLVTVMWSLNLGTVTCYIDVTWFRNTLIPNICKHMVDVKHISATFSWYSVWSKLAAVMYKAWQQRQRQLANQHESKNLRFKYCQKFSMPMFY